MFGSEGLVGLREPFAVTYFDNDDVNVVKKFKDDDPNGDHGVLGWVGDNL